MRLPRILTIRPHKIRSHRRTIIWTENEADNLKRGRKIGSVLKLFILLLCRNPAESVRRDRARPVSTRPGQARSGPTSAPYRAPARVASDDTASPAAGQTESLGPPRSGSVRLMYYFSNLSRYSYLHWSWELDGAAICANVWQDHVVDHWLIIKGDWFDWLEATIILAVTTRSYIIRRSRRPAFLCAIFISAVAGITPDGICYGPRGTIDSVRLVHCQVSPPACFRIHVREWFACLDTVLLTYLLISPFHISPSSHFAKLTFCRIPISPNPISRFLNLRSFNAAGEVLLTVSTLYIWCDILCIHNQLKRYWQNCLIAGTAQYRIHF